MVGRWALRSLGAGEVGNAAGAGRSVTGQKHSAAAGRARNRRNLKGERIKQHSGKVSPIRTGCVRNRACWSPFLETAAIRGGCLMAKISRGGVNPISPSSSAR